MPNSIKSICKLLFLNSKNKYRVKNSKHAMNEVVISRNSQNFDKLHSI
ncbi:NAD kinase [Aquimarina sp. EL_43]|nr:NAD kinase [Aquimarina sp. EL_35]MBG6153304.1 NAD kinase [Aquimarina sp. EL_32]MBG6171427.1 NAD kinase [Aquimarina sp. EL_43]